MENRIAILILAHHNAKQLSLLVRHLQPDFDVFVQIDKKSTLQINELPQLDGVYYYKEIAVFWGHFSLVENMRFILQKAFEKKYLYYLFISGDDLPIKSNAYITSFLEKHKETNFMYANPLPIATWGFNKGFDRLDRYWFMKIQNRKLSKIIGRLSLGMQRAFGIKIKRYPIDYYAGSQWVNMNHETVHYLFDFLDRNPNFFKKLKFSRATDEIWIQSIVMNSPFKNTVEKHDLRYIDWTTGPTFPRVLNHEDKDKLLNDKKGLFARKFDSNQDEDYIKSLLAELNS